jgi:DNA-binding transcriptional ArsR family regulator
MGPVERLEWLHAVSSSLCGAAVTVAISLAKYTSSSTGKSWPSRSTMGAGKFNERSVSRALRKLEKEGFISSEKRDGRTMVFTLTTPKPLTPESRVEPLTPETGVTPVSRVPLTPVSETPDTSVKGTKEEPSKINQVNINPPQSPDHCEQFIPTEIENPFDVGAVDTSPSRAISQAPLNIPSRLREAWKEISGSAGVETANKALEAAARHFGAASEKQVLQTYRAAHEARITDQPSDKWPNFLKKMEHDKLRQRTGTTAEQDDDEIPQPRIIGIIK